MCELSNADPGLGAGSRGSGRVSGRPALTEIGWRHMFSDAKRRPANDIRRDDHEQRVLFSAVLEVPVQPREGHEQREEKDAKRAEKAKRLSPFEFALRGPFQPKLRNRSVFR